MQTLSLWRDERKTFTMEGMSYAEELLRAREALDLTQEEAAERLHVSRVTYANWESGKVRPSRRYYDNIREVLGVSLTLTAESPPATYGLDNKYAFVPKYTAKAGAGIPQENSHEEVDGKYAYRRDWLEARKLTAAALVVIEAEGDSMHPTIFDGDTVLIDTLQKKIVSGRVFAFRTDDGTRIKRLHRQMDGRVKVSSDNPDKITYPEEFLTPGMDVDIIGMVVHRSGGV